MAETVRGNIKITLDTGRGGELRDYTVPQSVFGRLVRAANYHIEQLRRDKKLALCQSERDAQLLAQSIISDFTLY